MARRARKRATRPPGRPAVTPTAPPVPAQPNVGTDSDEDYWNPEEPTDPAGSTEATKGTEATGPTDGRAGTGADQGADDPARGPDQPTPPAVEADGAAEPQAEAKSAPEPEVEPEAEPEAEAKDAAEPDVAEPEADGAEPEADGAEPEADGAEPEADGAEPEAKDTTKPEAEAKDAAERKVEADPEPQATARPEAEPDADDTAEPGATADPEPGAQPDESVEREAKEEQAAQHAVKQADEQADEQADDQADDHADEHANASAVASAEAAEHVEDERGRLEPDHAAPVATRPRVTVEPDDAQPTGTDATETEPATAQTEETEATEETAAPVAAPVATVGAVVAATASAAGPTTGAARAAAPGSTGTDFDEFAAKAGERDPGERHSVEGKAAWTRLLKMSRPRATRGNVLVALLAVLLGAGIAAQVQLTNQRGLDELSQTDLVRVLDDVSLRASRLDSQVRELEATRDRLKSGTGTTAEALQQAQKRVDTLGILAGTIPAKGPGITLRISDPDNQITAPIVLDIIQELRDAGAEAIDVGGVRVVASSFVGDRDSEIVVDSKTVSRPLVITVIGDSKTLSSAMTIPGGIVESVRQKGANASIAESSLVEITSTHTPTELKNAKPVQ